MYHDGMYWIMVKSCFYPVVCTVTNSLLVPVVVVTPSMKNLSFWSSAVQEKWDV